MAAENVVVGPISELAAGSLGVAVGEALGMLILKLVTVGPEGVIIRLSNG